MMKNAILVFWVLLMQFVLVAQTYGYELSKGKIGPMKVGTHIFSLAHMDTQATVKRRQFEEEYLLEYTFTLHATGTVKALLSDDYLTVYRLTTISKSLKTAGGAHVGMTLNELKKVYPNGALAPSWESNESLYSFILPDQEGVFVFNAKPILKQCKDKHPDCGSFMGDLRSTEFFTY